MCKILYRSIYAVKFYEKASIQTFAQQSTSKYSERGFDISGILYDWNIETALQ